MRRRAQSRLARWGLLCRALADYFCPCVLVPTSVVRFLLRADSELMYLIRYIVKMKRPIATRGKRDVPQKRISAIFYRAESGGEPVRDWFKSLRKEERKLIGQDIMTVEFGWPIGMPVSRPLGQGLYEVRTNLPGHRIARVLFYIDRLNRMVLLHGFIKKTAATPADDLKLARSNKAKHQRGMK